MIRIHRRQFVLGPRTVAPYPDWIHRHLGPSLWLSACPELRAEWVDDADGAPWALLGHAVECRPEVAASPAGQIAGARSSQVPGLIDGWLGRWILLGADQVQLDAASRLGCLYGVDARGDCWASSSPPLLADRLWPEGPPAPDPRPLRYELGLTWYPAPATRLLGMSRLLASQVLDPRDGSVASRAIVPPLTPERGDEANRLRAGELMVTGLTRLAPLSDGPVHLFLSAGRDSRLALAMARRAGLDVACATRLAPRVGLGDRLLPPRLAALAGYPHRYLADRPSTIGAADLIARQTGGQLATGDAEPLARGARAELVGIGIGGWEPIGNPTRLNRAFDGRMPSPDEAARAILRLYGEPSDCSGLAPLRQWFAWAEATPVAHLDWRDRYTLEQPLGVMYSAKEQLYDVHRLIRVPVFNAGAINAAMLSLSEEHRRGRDHQTELIRWAAPQLLDLPVNPPDRHFGLGRALVRRARTPLATARMAHRSAIRVKRRLVGR